MNLHILDFPEFDKSIFGIVPVYVCENMIPIIAVIAGTLIPKRNELEDEN